VLIIKIVSDNERQYLIIICDLFPVTERVKDIGPKSGSLNGGKLKENDLMDQTGYNP